MTLLSRDCWTAIAKHCQWPEIWALSLVCRTSHAGCFPVAARRKVPAWYPFPDILTMTRWLLRDRKPCVVQHVGESVGKYCVRKAAAEKRFQEDLGPSLYRFFLMNEKMKESL